MKRMQRGWGAPDFTGALVVVAVLSAIAGAATVWLLVHLWGWLKPLIHAITA